MSGRIEEVRDRVVPVLRRYDVVRAAVFGSFVRGEMKAGSALGCLEIIADFCGCFFGFPVAYFPLFDTGFCLKYNALTVFPPFFLSCL